MASLRARLPIVHVLVAVVLFAAGWSLAACGFGLSSGAGGGGVSDPAVAATVNGRPIYKEDVREYAVHRGWVEDGAPVTEGSEHYHAALDILIEQRLFAMEALHKGLERQPDVRRRIENARETVLAAAVYEEIEQEAGSEERIEQLYEDYLQQVNAPEEYHLRQLALRTREEAQVAHQRLSEGNEEFGRLAYELMTDANGGDIGWHVLEYFGEPVRNALAGSSEGDLVGPVQFGDHWFIFRIDGRRSQGGRSLAELRPLIVEWLRYDETRKRYERLYRDARIERPRRAEPGDAEAPAPRAPSRPRPDTPPSLGGEPPPFPFPVRPGAETPAPQAGPAPQAEPAPQQAQDPS